MPFATSSQRVMPPKMLNRIAFTLGSERITSSAVTILSASAPPPTSRKFAGLPPTCSTTSSVDITSPAPLPRMPMAPSSFTYVTSPLARHLLLRVGCRGVAHLLDVGVPEQRVVVDRDLRVGGDDVALAR